MHALKILLAIMFAFALTGCVVRGTYTGGGWIDTDDEGGTANFGFNATNCDGYVTGHFNFVDNSFDNKADYVKMNGDVEEFIKCGIGCIYPCDYYSTVEYRSTNPKNRGDGEVFVCAGDGGEGANGLELDDFFVYVFSGPYEGTQYSGTVHGNIQSHECAD